MATELQIKVWDTLQKIPKGKVITYKHLAEVVGKPTAHRSVASAVGKNSKLVTVPCHRVVRSDGLVGEYAGGREKKITLLKSEGVEIRDGKIVDKRVFAKKV